VNRGRFPPQGEGDGPENKPPSLSPPALKRPHFSDLENGTLKMTYYRDNTRPYDMGYYHARARFERSKAIRGFFMAIFRAALRLLPKKKGRAK